MKEKYIFLSALICIFFIRGFSQKQLDSIRIEEKPVEFYLNTIDSLNIRKVKLIKYLSPDDNLKLGLNQNIYSEITEYYYKKNMLVKDSKYYSGIDKDGIDHFTKNSTGFNTYSMIFENYYEYNKHDSLIRIDQNTPFKTDNKFFQNLHEIKPEQFIIDKTPINKYLLINFNTDNDAVLWQITKNRYLYFKIVE